MIILPTYYDFINSISLEDINNIIDLLICHARHIQLKLVKNSLLITDLTISTDKSKFDELKNSGKIENYRIIDDVNFLIINHYYYW